MNRKRNKKLMNLHIVADKRLMMPRRHFHEFIKIQIIIIAKSKHLSMHLFIIIAHYKSIVRCIFFLLRLKSIHLGVPNN